MTKTAPVLLDWAEARLGSATLTPTANIKRLRVTLNICSSFWVSGKTLRRTSWGVRVVVRNHTGDTLQVFAQLLEDIELRKVTRIDCKEFVWSGEIFD